ncbi:MAG: CHRD domain-containing protein, partial [Desulforhabdus sp.]|nr:CHRD domain-containing protein [Desulforhabdus sp.]
MESNSESFSIYAALVALCAVLMVIVTSHAGAAVISFNATLEGAQEVPPVVTSGSGKGSMFYNDATNQLDWLVVFDGLTGPAIGAHFHGPAGIGANAGIQVDVGPISGLNSPMLGSAILTDAQESQLLGGLWYFNVHTSAFPNGEIRGQVLSSSGGDFSQRLLSGDLDGNGSDDLIGLTMTGEIFYSLDLATWQHLPGVLSRLAVGDLNGDGRDDIAGVTSDGLIFYTLNLSTWQQ